MDSVPSFQPCQIVCLEHEDFRLYGEVIQIVQERQVCWVRPLGLIVLTADPADSLTWQERFTAGAFVLHDLREGADLLWPASLFRPALDTEVMPILMQLYNAEIQTKPDRTARQKLNSFVQEVWQANANVFQAQMP